MDLKSLKIRLFDGWLPRLSGKDCIKKREAQEISQSCYQLWTHRHDVLKERQDLIGFKVCKGDVYSVGLQSYRVNAGIK